MRKLLILAIFAAALYHYYYGFGSHLLPDVDLGNVAGDLKRNAKNKKDPTELSFKCPHGYYVAVAPDLQSATCAQRTQL
ncbi:hypothetical protein CWI80_00460 [Pseudidiomarina sediminum]|uniref:Uncharacterized protein n=1 Tax=Pseudidiomarina sediminum TaxID=431675 RepID=A0A432Z7Q5_9GAMM|nr:hypothetical protein [Pseudidiomarina sediminum]MBY6063020.1 hypothetical protein [Pseudidiomarina sediminum]RUO73875.1 hypothetical protein CWI80_00460 [Pseudidiomarina sediminum]